MPKVVFVLNDGNTRTVETHIGETVMDAALDNMIPGVKAQCGGGITCSTCHCYVHEDWLHRLPEPVPDEKTMLEYVWQPLKNSRLCCQIVLTEEMDGIVVHVPKKQL